MKFESMHTTKVAHRGVVCDDYDGAEAGKYWCAKVKHCKNSVYDLWDGPICNGIFYGEEKLCQK